MAHVEYKSFIIAMLSFRNLKILQESSLCTLLLTCLPRDIDIHGIRGAIQFSDFPSATTGRTAKSGLSLSPPSLFLPHSADSNVTDHFENRRLSKRSVTSEFFSAARRTARLLRPARPRVTTLTAARPSDGASLPPA